MSGLYTYFREFLPQEEVDGDSVVSPEISYEVSLASHPPNIHDNHEPVTHCEEQNWKEWRRERINQLQDYMEKRLVPSLECDEQDYEPDDGGNDSEATKIDAENSPPDNNDDVPHSQVSQIAISQQSSALSGIAASIRSRRKRIPHVDETTQDVSLAQDLNMYTRSANFRLCLVQKIWQIRETKRAARVKISSKVHPPVIPGILPRQLFRNFDDDGPLATCYKKVMSMEVIQLIEPSSLPQVTFNSLDHQRQQPPRFMVFLYGKYAQCLASLVEREDLNIILSLEQVPARCILPYAVDHRYFDSTEMLPFCICIGDDSIMKILDDGTGSDVNTRFDVPDLKVNVAVWGKGSKTKKNQVKNAMEISMTPETLKPETMRQLHPSPLFQSYKRFQELSDNRGTYGAEVGNDHPTAKNGDRGSKGPLDLPRELTQAAKHGSDSRLSVDVNGSASGAAATPNEPIEDNQTLAEGDDSHHATTGQRKRALSDAAGEGASKRQEQQPSAQHHYYTLTELLQILEKQDVSHASSWPPGEFDVYAAIVRFSSRSRTHHGDWKVTLSLVDESLPLPGATSADGLVEEPVKSVTANIFCKELDQLPQVQRAGDVIRMHRMALQKYNGELQLLGKRASSYVVCRASESNEEWEIIPTAKESFSIVADDRIRFSELWKWASGRILSHPTMPAAHRFTLADMKCQGGDSSPTEGESIDRRDLTAMVAAIIPIPIERRTGATPMGYLRLWDGTGVSTSDPLPIATPAAHNSVRYGDPPSSSLVRISSIIKLLENEGVYKTTAYDPPKSLCGRVANAVIWESSHWTLVTSVIRIGDFIRLRNIRDNKDTESGLRCLMVHPGSSLTPLPGMTYEVRVLLEQHRERITRNDPFNRQSGVLPLSQGDEQATEGTDKAFVSAADHAESRHLTVHTLAHCVAAPAPSVFDVEVRVRATIPDVGAECVNLRNVCRKDHTSSDHVFKFALRLVDNSREIDAIVSSDVGEALFGASASDVWRQPHEFAGILRGILLGNALFMATIRSVEIDGAKYFVLESILNIV